jgi:sporulation protein YlmC with PRC-barrel domain
MKTLNRTVLGFSLLAFTAAVYAQSGSTQSGQQEKSQPMQQAQQGASDGASAQQRSEITARRLMDAKVVDSQGKELGDISEVVIDLQKDRVHAVVLEFGGFMGLGGKQFAFPMSELKPGKDHNQFVMNVDKQKLENAEGFAKGKIPGMDDQYWTRVGGQRASAGAQQQQEAGQKAQAGAGQGQKFNLVQASKMMGAEVQDKTGQQIGEIRDVVIGTNDGQLKNVVINVKDAGEARVPAKGLSSGTGDRLVLDMAADRVRAQAKKTDRRAERDTGAATGATTGPAATTQPGTTTRGSGTPAPAGAGTQERPAQAQERGSAK